MFYGSDNFIFVLPELFIVKMSDIAGLHITFITLIVLASIVHHVGEEV